ncbi:hypothetical protein KFL_011710010 [Klebsormidium nitens]|uniref:Uncharacterized protein n=1 Tax=Klebsormidium nitens TaxID=105231 RepID=A0A1Y1IPS4_KLENI|nr:hypothetical protein KFL_011710010 [Klebsormidium nitens]|eukprot:GAQ92860.1 hypothetical protein KFL_011710010 [Klebsormidium nitens]
MDRYMWPPGVEPALKKGVYLASKVQVEACMKRLDPSADLTNLWGNYPWHIPAVAAVAKGVDIDGLSPVKSGTAGARKKQKGPGQCVFLRPEQENTPPFILLITELFPPNHPSGKTGAGYFFWRAEDIRVLSGISDFQGSKEDSEVYVTRHRAEFEVDEILDLTDVQPFFVGENLDGLYYKSVWDYDSGLLKHIDFNLEGSSRGPSSLPRLLKYLQAQAYRNTSEASDMIADLARELGQNWWIKYAQTARVGGDMNSYEIHLPIVFELAPAGDKLKVRMHGLEMFNLAGASQWDTRCNPLAMKRVPK